jgi:hypothetical protein
MFGWNFLIVPIENLFVFYNGQGFTDIGFISIGKSIKNGVFSGVFLSILSTIFAY